VISFSKIIFYRNFLPVELEGVSFIKKKRFFYNFGNFLPVELELVDK
jgi:hypothetical protein